jgi:dTDP-4-amino-4,6-dideoxygalactose transaminase
MIQYGRHSINDDDIQSVSAALRSDWLTTGPLVEKFESEIERVVGAPTVTVTSGTAALHCAYAAIGIKPGDEVITPPITFVATQATAALMGAKIVFADIRDETGNIDPVEVEAAITGKTKAIVAVDYAGHPANLSELRALADKHGIFLIEDAAHSIGSIYKGVAVGSIADITTFSFFPTKNMTTTEGGAVSSTSPELLEKAKKFSRQGLVRDPAKFKLIPDGPWHQEVHDFGLNYRLPDVLCALGISQISRLEDFKRRRKEIFEFYVSNLTGFRNIRLPQEVGDVDVNWHLFPIRVPQQERRVIFEEMRRAGIGVQVNYIPAYRHPVFAPLGINPNQFPQSEAFYASEISLPMHYQLEFTDLEFVIKTLKGLLN